ncbi:MAG: SGNH/GDSL hydrolase family protein [Pirellulaceae bacterium]
MMLSCFVVTVPAQSAEGEVKNPSLRWEKDIAKFRAADAKEKPAEGQVVFVGSSSIKLWDLPKYFPEREEELINRGFGGSKIEDSVYYADQIVTPLKPRTIVFYAGDNDIASKYTPERVAADFQRFTTKIHDKLPKTKVVFIAIKPSISRWKIVDNVRAANRLIAEICAADDRLEFVDVDGPMLGEDGTPDPKLFVKDGLHLSDSGYKLWVSLVSPHLD